MREAQGIHRSRRRGWRRPPDAVIVDRSSRYGNPFAVQQILAAGEAEAAASPSSAYTAWLDGEAFAARLR